jgi:enoyl-CoA hydratase/carnithine racemase
LTFASERAQLGEVFVRRGLMPDGRGQHDRANRHVVGDCYVGHR